MTPFNVFLATLAIGAGIAISIAIFFAVVRLFDNGFRLLENFAAAAQRYAVRNEVVTEYYDACNMQHVRRITDAKPHRVTVAKKKATK